MRLLIRTVAVLAGLSALGMLWAMAGVAGAGEIRTVAASGVFGWLTLLGWVIAIAAGPIALVQLWRFRESGRRAAIVLFAYGLAYYVAGLYVLRSPGPSGSQMLIAAASFAVPLAVLFLPRTRMLCSART